MAVVQISKIQLRRGQKNFQSGIPQLSSAEMAWAVDSQELYIGNGSVAEGAPYVGNTKILTEHDNILELTAGYTFRRSDPAITRSITRSLQSKIDETVSVIDYGAVPDGSTDCTLAFEAAFADLFDSVDTDNRKILLVPNGRYSFNLPARPLRIPSWATLQGENSSQTVLDIGNSGIEFVKGNSEEYPRDITIANLTIEHRDGQTDITASRHCEFENVTWKSDYQLSSGSVFEPENANALYSLVGILEGGFIEVSGTGVSQIIKVNFTGNSAATLSTVIGSLDNDSVFNADFTASAVDLQLKITAKSPQTTVQVFEENFSVIFLGDGGASSVLAVAETEPFRDGSENVEASVFWNNLSFSTRTSNIVFKECAFKNTKLAIECQQSLVFDTVVDFSNCKFLECDTAIYIGGVAPDPVLGSQGNEWSIVTCSFELIANQAVLSTFGIGTTITDSKFRNCGNGSSTAQFPITSIVKFGEKFNNLIVDCSSDRHQNSAFTGPQATQPAVVEFENVSCATLIDKNHTSISFSNSARALSVLPIENNHIELDYILLLSGHVRKGKLTLVIGDAKNSTNVGLYDEYTYSPIGAGVSNPGGPLMTNFNFSAEIKTVNSKSTVILQYLNPTAMAELGTISYSISYSN